MEGIIKSDLISLRLRLPLLLLFLSISLHISPFFPLPKTCPCFAHLSLPPSPPIHSCCRGNNTKIFFAALSPWQRLAFLEADAGSTPLLSSRVGLTTVTAPPPPMMMMERWCMCQHGAAVEPQEIQCIDCVEHSRFVSSWERVLVIKESRAGRL